jgi:hypothetical protein
MSFVAKCSRRLQVKPEVAFDRLADYASWGSWMPSSFRPAADPSGTLSLGRRIRVRIAGAPAPATIEVSELRRPSEIAWSGGVRGILWANHRFLFEADGSDATTVTSQETWEGVLSGLVRLVLQPMAERIGRHQLEALARSLS